MSNKLPVIPYENSGAEGKSVTAVGPGAERLARLSQQHPNTPPRQVDFGEGRDPFGLLEHEDTYGVYAGLVFTECEGVYKMLGNRNHDVIKQLKAKPAEEKLLTFPTTKLGELYSYNMVRSESGEGTTYTFQRADKGYEDKGFMVKRSGDNHFVLRNLAQGDTDIHDDESYWNLLDNARDWVHDYADSLHINSDNLLGLAQAELKPHKLRAKLGRLATNAAHGTRSFVDKGKVSSFARTLLTKPDYKYVWLDRITAANKASALNSNKRIPRWLGIAAMAAVIPTSLQPTFTIESAAAGVRVAAVDFGHGLGIGVPSQEQQFDSQHLNLPAGAATVKVTPVQTTTPIPYAKNLNPEITKAPVWDTAFDGGDNGSFANGSIRHLIGVDDNVYADGFDGIGPGSCATYDADMPSDTTVKAINTNPYASSYLYLVTAAPQELMVCDEGTKSISDAGLNGLYVQMFFSHRSDKHK